MPDSATSLHGPCAYAGIMMLSRTGTILGHQGSADKVSKDWDQLASEFGGKSKASQSHSSPSLAVRRLPTVS